MQIINLYPKK